MVRLFIYILLVVFVNSKVFAQQAQETNPLDSLTQTGINTAKPKLYLFFSTGISRLGPKNDIEASMAIGFGGISHSWFGSGLDYPITHGKPNFKIGTTYFPSKNIGVSIQLGLINNIEVLGLSNGYETYDSNYTLIRSVPGLELAIKSKIWATSLNFIICTTNKRSTLFVGPAIIVHTLNTQLVVDDYLHPGVTVTKQNNTLLGFNVGYSGQLIQKEKWFLAFNMEYLWAPSSKFGPIDYSTYATNKEFQQTTSRVSCLNMSLCLGIAISKQ